ncbi:crotonase/enoyl-CoA hydratase family protein [Thiohalorhabdus sp.]|uniref:crotonase/enoyl-CoA hydratase family protein n=1 Tax=Thiohalorhabdus sp. TaxID=3094134 RepID=UPI002FC397B1
MSNLIPFPKSEGQNQQSQALINNQEEAAYIFMEPRPRPSFTPQLLADLQQFKTDIANRVQSELEAGHPQSLRYAVVASGLPGVFNYGGDLDLFGQLIRNGDGQGLRDYALRCIQVAHDFSVGFDLPLTTIALVEGRAQGGGFEAALACNVLIAERDAQMGFPEVLFNLFPGMGAYSFLSRKIAPGLAERMILSGRLYSAEELYDMGVVDFLAEPGEGREKLQEFMTDADKHRSVQRLFQRVHARHNRVPFEELRDIAELWVESALALGERDVRTMERLVRAQDRRTGKEDRQAN